MRRGPFPKARPNEADPRCYDQGIPWGVPTTRTRRTSLSRPFSFFFQPEGGTMPPDTLFSFFSPTHTRSHTLPPHQKTHTPGDVRSALQLRVDGLRWAGQEKVCRRGERKEGRGHPRARARAPPHFFSLLAETSGSRRSRSFSLPRSRSAFFQPQTALPRSRGGGRARPRAAPRDLSLAGRAVRSGAARHTRRDTHTRAHPFLLFTPAFSLQG